jgi:hypothetical protein
MKHRKIELDVDFIGGEGPLKKEDADAISEYIRNYKAKNSPINAKGKRVRKSSGRKKKLTA